MQRDELKRANGRVLRKTLLVALVMFGFGFALVPFYNLVCSAFGLNGQTEQITAEDLAKEPIDTSRTITVEFNALVNSKLPWAFKPEVTKLEMHPGEVCVKADNTGRVQTYEDRVEAAQQSRPVVGAVGAAVAGFGGWLACAEARKTRGRREA